MNLFNLLLLSVILGGSGAVLLVIHSDFDPPTETDLVQVSGDIDTIVIADDFADPEEKFDTPLPLDSIFIRLKGAQQEYRYRAIWPNFGQVLNINMASSIDIWVDSRHVSAGAPLEIFQLVERNPFHDNTEVLLVDYQVRLTAQEAVVRNHRKVGGWLLGTSAAVSVLGLLTRRLRRRRSTSAKKFIK